MSADVQERALSYEEERGKPTPSLNHGILQACLIVQLAKQEKHDVVSELTLDLDLPDGRKLVPDICLRPAAPADWDHDDIVPTEAPPMALEIQSPTQGSEEMTDKASLYLSHGVRSVWLVIPLMRGVLIYTSPEGSPTRHFEGIVTDPATGAQIDLDEVFR